MILQLRIQLWTALGFAVYVIGLTAFFDAFRFLDDSHANWLRLLLLLCMTGVIEFAILFFLLRPWRAKGVNKLIFSTSFLVAGCLPGVCFWLISAGANGHFFPFISSFVLVSILPLIFSLLVFIYFETVEKMAQFNQVSLRQGEEGDRQQDKVFHLENSNGKLLLEIPIMKIICFEANDNYVVIYFIKNENETGKSMERVSLRKIEEMLDKETVEFKRVHKSYLVNPAYIEEVKGRAQAYKIKLKHFQNLIPVSRSYNIGELNKY